MGAKKKSILLIEDNPNDVELTLTALEEHGLASAVTVARDGEEALDFLLQRGRFSQQGDSVPAVIFLDLKLPKIDGLEVLQAIKSHPRLRYVPVAMLTSSREERDVLACYQHGVSAYVVKPVDFTEFQSAIHSLALFWIGVNELPPTA